MPANYPTAPVRMAGAALAVTCVLVALGTGRADAARVACGDTIKKDTTLHADLRNCPDNGIKIGADGIRLDLNGHTIDGDDEGVKSCPRSDFCDSGVVLAGHERVHVRGGTVKQFAAFGVFVYRGTHVSVERVDALNNGLNGVLFASSARSRLVHGSTIRNGLENDYPGIAVVYSRHIAVRDVESTHNADLGLFTIAASHARIVGNAFSSNPEAAMIFDGSGSTIARNAVAHNPDGIIVAGNRNRVVGNRISDASLCGHHCGTGISLEDGHGNVLARNRVTRAAGVGIRVSTFAPQQRLVGTAVRHNVVREAGRVGILAGAGTRHTRIAGNHVRGSGANGIRSKSGSTHLNRNHANDNGGHGIVAKAHAHGHGNEADHNGKQPQCVNVRCR